MIMEYDTDLTFGPKCAWFVDPLRSQLDKAIDPLWFNQGEIEKGVVRGGGEGMYIHFVEGGVSDWFIYILLIG